MKIFELQLTWSLCPVILYCHRTLRFHGKWHDRTSHFHAGCHYAASAFAIYCSSIILYWNKNYNKNNNMAVRFHWLRSIRVATHCEVYVITVRYSGWTGRYSHDRSDVVYFKRDFTWGYCNMAATSLEADLKKIELRTKRNVIKKASVTTVSKRKVTQSGVF